MRQATVLKAMRAEEKERRILVKSRDWPPWFTDVRFYT